MSRELLILGAVIVVVGATLGFGGTIWYAVDYSPRAVFLSFAGFSLGFLGIALALLGFVPFAPNAHTVQPPALSRVCVSCRRGIPFDAVHCPHCGYEYPPMQGGSA